MIDNNGFQFPAILCVLGYFFLITLILLAAAVRIVPEGKKLTVYRMGRLLGERGPGLVLLIPFLDRGVLSGGGQAPAGAAGRYPVGVLGQATSLVETRGEVLIDGVTWKATSAHSILPGSRVRVKDVIVEVEME